MPLQEVEVANGPIARGCQRLGMDVLRRESLK